MIKLKINKNLKKGFSIVEVVTVLFIVSLGLVGVLSLIVQNIQSQNVNKGALMAYQLAQEGIELVRHTRDSNWAAGQSWQANLSPNHYTIDYRDLAPRNISVTGQDRLKQDAAGFFYNQNSANDPNMDSGFSRVIDITANPNNSQSIIVRSTINWKDHSKNFNYFLETALYDWK